LAAAINQIAEDATLRSAMGEASRARVLAQFTWQGIAERTADVYQGVLARAPGRP
jgi:starch synthase